MLSSPLQLVTRVAWAHRRRWRLMCCKRQRPHPVLRQWQRQHLLPWEASRSRLALCHLLCLRLRQPPTPPLVWLEMQIGTDSSRCRLWRRRRAVRLTPRRLWRRPLRPSQSHTWSRRRSADPQRSPLRFLQQQAQAAMVRRRHNRYLYLYPEPLDLRVIRHLELRPWPSRLQVCPSQL